LKIVESCTKLIGEGGGQGVGGKNRSLGQTPSNPSIWTIYERSL